MAALSMEASYTMTRSVTCPGSPEDRWARPPGLEQVWRRAVEPTSTDTLARRFAPMWGRAERGVLSRDRTKGIRCSSNPCYGKWALEQNSSRRIMELGPQLIAAKSPPPLD